MVTVALISAKRPDYPFCPGPKARHYNLSQRQIEPIVCVETRAVRSPERDIGWEHTAGLRAPVGHSGGHRNFAGQALAMRPTVRQRRLRPQCVNRLAEASCVGGNPALRPDCNCYGAVSEDDGLGDMVALVVIAGPGEVAR